MVRHDPRIFAHRPADTPSRVCTLLYQVGPRPRPIVHRRVEMSRPVLRTAFCDRIGIEYPVVSAGMGPVAGTGAPVATAELAAAVSNAGGLGVIGGVAYSPDVLRAEIRKIRALTDKPFGVDLLLAPNFLVPQTGARSAAPRPDQLPKAHVEAIERIAASLGIELKQ